MNDSRFAVYLVPPYQLARDISEVHHLLRKQYGFSAADRFQVHCTIKGFFKKNDRSADELENELELFFQDQRPIPVSIEGYRADQIGFGLSLMNYASQPNKPFLTFREDLVEITRPYIAEDCDFIDRDLGREFHPHITFAFRDIPEDLYENVLGWLENGPDLKQRFLADTYNFLEFFSEDWNGNWWETLTWRLIKSWVLKKDQE
jgi:2'-5' RNA ligase